MVDAVMVPRANANCQEDIADFLLTMSNDIGDNSILPEASLLSEGCGVTHSGERDIVIEVSWLRQLE